MFLLWTDEGRHGRPDTTRIYRDDDGTYLTVRRHGGGVVGQERSKDRPRTPHDTAVPPHEVEAGVTIPPGSEWTETMLRWHHNKQKLNGWEVAPVLADHGLEVPTWLKFAYPIRVYCEGEPALHNAQAHGFTVRLIGTI